MILTKYLELGIRDLILAGVERFFKNYILLKFVCTLTLLIPRCSHFKRTWIKEFKFYSNRVFVFLRRLCLSCSKFRIKPLSDNCFVGT